MSATNLDHTDLSSAAFGGVVSEDVMSRIWDISHIPLPLTDMCSTKTSGNQFKEFTTDELGAPAVDNRHVDGADTDQDDSQVGERMGNYHQISIKEIRVSHSANESDSIGNAGSLSYQIMQGQRRLRRDVEAQMCTSQRSIAPDANADVAGQSAGLGAWISTNVLAGAGGTSGGWNPATGIIDAPGAGANAALSEEAIRDVAQMVYMHGGEAEYLMSTPGVIRSVSEYLFTSSARVATMMNDNASGTDPMTAYGSTNVFVSDFAVLKFKDNRMQQEEAAGKATLFVLDPAHLAQSFLQGYKTDPLGKTGLSDKRLISCEYTLLALNEKSQGAIRDIDTAAPMVADNAHVAPAVAGAAQAKQAAPKGK